MFELPDLPFEYNALEPFIDKETMQVHHDGHHAAYVKNLNEALAGLDEFLNMDIRELLQSLDKVPDELQTKVKNNAGGHYHHSLFWTMIAHSSGQEPGGRLLKEIEKELAILMSYRRVLTCPRQIFLEAAGLGWFGITAGLR